MPLCSRRPWWLAIACALCYWVSASDIEDQERGRKQPILPSVPECRKGLAALLLSSSAEWEPGEDPRSRFIGCAQQPEESDDERCCRFFENFGLGRRLEGCFCLEAFYQIVRELFVANVAPTATSDLNSVAGWCVERGYQLPYRGNLYCPAEEEDGEECSSSSALTVEKEALLQLQVNSSVLYGWSEDVDVCCWEGITCDAQLHVTSLQLGKKAGLSGTLPASLSALTNLSSLSLSGGNMSGSLPHPWSRLSCLQFLSVARHRLTGTLPPQYSSLTGLSHLSLNGNRLSGPLPDSYSTFQASNLAITLSANRITGTLPPSWSAMTGVSSM